MGHEKSILVAQDRLVEGSYFYSQPTLASCRKSHIKQLSLIAKMVCMMFLGFISRWRKDNLPTETGKYAAY
jgi:hypothetical protein